MWIVDPCGQGIRCVLMWHQRGETGLVDIDDVCGILQSLFDSPTVEEESWRNAGVMLVRHGVECLYGIMHPLTDIADG